MLQKNASLIDVKMLLIDVSFLQAPPNWVLGWEPLSLIPKASDGHQCAQLA
jgi:hypothetical protein